jgi:hypothetical protein
MNIRPFEWHDLPALYHYRNQCVYLDTIRILTSGPNFVPTGALLSMMAPATGYYTYLYQDDEPEHAIFFGQVSHAAGSASAHLTFVAPNYALAYAQLAPLFDHLASHVGERGAMHLVADVEEQSLIAGLLRQAGFGIYARQRTWQLNPSGISDKGRLWRAATRQDEAAVHFLYTSLVPGLVQQVETLPTSNLHGLVYYRGSELLAYVDLISSLNGVLALPYIHPDAEAIAVQLVHLLQRPPHWRSRPVYICVRSYQSWLDPILQGLDAQPGAAQAVMVRRLAVRRTILAQSMTALNHKSTEPTVPVAHIWKKDDRKKNHR